LISEGIEELKTEGIIRIEIKRTGRGSAPHATLAKEALARSRGLLNAYRKSEGLPTLGKDLKMLLPI